ncbi:polysaccharide deacetylase family protein [Dactylosporangium fulvum]|uniref:Polysaccharide deacetylase family protein n=1 Tax=Dactylosporangium fulvum TaxID=53359 RepID=A0ABY5VQU9_9ACTN|nr:polysaccharide deacetylase family protein [Dactylosporangium fulvum]UWP79184.1 polysaccharide deacetylase family protein [Dactylosporangium fulvum]
MRNPVILVLAACLFLTACTSSSGASQPAARPSSDAVAVTADPVTATASSTPSASPAVLPGATRPGSVPPVVDNGPRIGNRVALTFDADMTDTMLRRLAADPTLSFANRKVIDILERTGTPATFFLTGEWVEAYPDVTRRLAANPAFELANHTYRHQAFKSPCYNLPSIAPAQMTEDVAHTFDVIAPYGGRQTRYFRFPGLCYDDAALQALAPLGVTVVQGDVVSGDPNATAAQPIVQAVLTGVRPGSIVIMHITEANARFTDEALQPILDGLRARGLRPVPLSDLFR